MGQAHTHVSEDSLVGCAWRRDAFRACLGGLGAASHGHSHWELQLRPRFEPLKITGLTIDLRVSDPLAQSYAPS